MTRTNKMVSPLKEIVGESHIIQDPDLKTYAIDGKKPKTIVSPGTMDEVSKVVAHANQQHLVIIPRGNGTKMGMGGIPQKMDIGLAQHHHAREVGEVDAFDDQAGGAEEAGEILP